MLQSWPRKQQIVVEVISQSRTVLQCDLQTTQKLQLRHWYYCYLRHYHLLPLRLQQRG